MGGPQVEFLYRNRSSDISIELLPGIAFCLRRFHELIRDLVHIAWTRYIRRQNHDVLGTTADLSEFLFGSERSDLSVVRPILHDLQLGRCFYCDGNLPANSGQVDHFIPWSKYPVDLGHNFVVAHQGCNSQKADHLAAADFLVAWADRNKQYGSQLGDAVSQRGVLHDLPTSVRITDWAYQQTFDANGLTWQRGNDMTPLPPGWQEPLRELLNATQIT